MNDMTINKDSNWNGIWRTRNGSIVKVLDMDGVLLGFQLGSKIIEHYNNDDGLHLCKEGMDLVNRVREGSDEYGKLVKDFAREEEGKK